MDNDTMCTLLNKKWLKNAAPDCYLCSNSAFTTTKQHQTVTHMHRGWGFSVLLSVKRQEISCFLKLRLRWPDFKSFFFLYRKQCVQYLEYKISKEGKKRGDVHFENKRSNANLQMSLLVSILTSERSFKYVWRTQTPDMDVNVAVSDR